jgi:hypothetical protein
VRAWYIARVSRIPELNHQWKRLGLSLRDRAIAAWRVRHDARLKARSMMLDRSDIELLQARDLAIYGNPNGPSFAFLVKYLQDRGLVEDEVYEAIIEGSYRTNAGINRILGL